MTSFAYVLCSANSCTRVTIQDGEWCGDIGDLGAHCAHMISPAERDLNKQQWDDLRFGQVCAASSVYVNLKTVLEQLCANTNDCTYEQVQAIQQFGSRLDEFRSRAQLEHEDQGAL